MKKGVKILVGFPVLALLMFGVINQSLCGKGEYYMRFTEIEVALVSINNKTVFDTIHYTYPKVETVIDSINYCELDSIHTGNQIARPGILISFGIDYCDLGAGNIAHAADVPGGGGFIHPLKSVRLFSRQPSGALIDISSYPLGLDSNFQYRWKNSSEIKFGNACSYGNLSGLTDSFNLNWRINRPPGMRLFDDKIGFLYGLDSTTFSKIPDTYELRVIVEFEDGHIVESKCSGRKIK